MNKDDTRMTDVLIIDDDEQVCRFLSKIFTGMGYDVSYELTLKQGLSKIFSHSVDILFLDVHLPEHIRAFNIRHKFAARGNAGSAAEKSRTSAMGPAETMPVLKDHIENTKAAYLQHLLAVTRGNIKESCRISGLSRGHLYRLMQQYHIKTNADS